MMKSIQEYPQSSNDNDYYYDCNDDDDGFIPIPREMFEMDPPSPPPA